jgi:hypothetical protein
MKRNTSFTKGARKLTPGYNSWRGMLQRCSDPKHNSFRYYGARGIQVCARWRSFENFLADLGPRPSKLHSLERPNGGDYAPGRVIWGTWAEQVASRAPADPCALSQAGKKGSSAKKRLRREALERAEQCYFAFA